MLAALLARWTLHRLGGDTGDTLGGLHVRALTGSFAGGGGMGMILLRHTQPDAPKGCAMAAGPAAAMTVSPTRARAGARAAAARGSSPRPCSAAPMLAEAIATFRGLPVTTDPRLREMDFGIWEGKQWSDLPRTELDAWADDLLHARPHGGESVAGFRTRALASGVARPCWARTR